jgi:hypothetical protein
VGYTLAKKFLQNIDNQLNTESSVIHDNKVPTFFLPVPVGCFLPEDVFYFKIKAVKELNPKILVRIVFVI